MKVVMQRISLVFVAVLATFVNANYVDFEVEFDLNGKDPRSVEPYVFEDTIKQMIEKLAAQLAEKDPLTIPKVDLNTGNNTFYINLQIEDLIVRGFSSIKLTEIKISVISMKATFRLEFDVLQLVAPYYKLDGLLAIFPIYGSGTYNLRVLGLGIAGTAKVNIMGASIKDLNFEFFVNETNLRVTGFLNNEPLSDIISTSVTECFPVFMKSYGKRFGELLGGVVQDAVNDALHPKADPEPNPQPEPETKSQPETYRNHQLRL